jgi:hypothetical protein
MNNQHISRRPSEAERHSIEIIRAGGDGRLCKNAVKIVKKRDELWVAGEEFDG